MTLTKNYLVLVDMVKKADYNAKITKIKGKIHNIIGLATTAALNAVENTIADVRKLVKKTDDDAKIFDIQAKFFTTFDFNKFKCEILNTNINHIFPHL